MLAGALGVFFLINAVATTVVYSPQIPPSVSISVVLNRWLLLRSMKKPVDVIFFGDSSGMRGFDPAVFSKKMGSSALNLCTSMKCDLINNVWLLEAYIKAWGSPKAVIITHVPDSWTMDHRDREWAVVPLRFKEWYSLKNRPSINESGATAVFSARYISLLYLKVFAHSKINSLLLPSNYFSYHDGFEGINLVGPNAAKTLDLAAKPGSSQETFYLGPLAKNELDALSHLAETHGFKLFIVFPPQKKGVENPKLIRQIQDYFSSYALGRKNVFFISDPIVLPPSDFYDDVHVHSRGAVDYSAAVARQLAPYLRNEVAGSGAER